MKKVNIQTPGGKADCYLFQPDENIKYPAILFYMDAFGIRRALFDMARRLADNGYFVLLPNLYYRNGFTAPFDPATAFNPGPERERLMALIHSLTIKSVMEDTASLIDYLSRESSADYKKIGCVGYCMGGKYALSAAAYFPGNVLAVASVHGGNLVTDRPDSPHLLASRIKGNIYIGIAANDRSFTDEHKQKLQEAFTAARVKSTLEDYPGAAHGFAVSDSSVYNQEAAEHHWERILLLFHENLKRQ